MKKSLLALAVLGAFAGTATAQSSVTLSGIFKVGFHHTSYSDGGGSVRAFGDGSSRFILSGTEDLGGGLRANFQIDSRFRVDEATQSIAGGNTFVGLSGGFGAIQIGKLDTHYCYGADTHGSRATALSASSCGILGFVGGAGAANSIANASRAQNIIRYTTPSLGGLRGELNYTPGFRSSEALPGQDKKNGYAARLTYAGGPFSGGLSYWDVDDDVANNVANEQRAWTLHGLFNFGMGTVGLTYDVSRTTLLGALGGAAAERTAWSVPVTFNVGPGTALLTYTTAGNWKNKSTGVKASDTGATLISVGYDFALSKRSSIGISYARMNNDSAGAYGLYTGAALHNAPAPAAGRDQSQVYLGIRHTF